MDSTIPEAEKLGVVFKLYQVVLEGITDKAPVGFTSLFARLVYILNRYKCSSQDVRLHHHFRKALKANEIELYTELIAIGYYLINSLGEH